LHQKIEGKKTRSTVFFPILNIKKAHHKNFSCDALFIFVLNMNLKHPEGHFTWLLRYFKLNL